MNKKFSLFIRWLDNPGIDYAIGVEADTWAELTINIGNKQFVTIGGMSGLFEWFVENWLKIFCNGYAKKLLPLGYACADLMIPTPEIYFLPQNNYIAILVGYKHEITIHKNELHTVLFHFFNEIFLHMLCYSNSESKNWESWIIEKFLLLQKEEYLYEEI